MMQFFPVESFVIFGGSALAFEIRIDRLSHIHSLSFEKKAEVAVLSRQLTLPILSFKVVDSLDMTSEIRCFLRQ